MITTRNINATIDKQRGKKLRYKTTKNIGVKNLGDGKPLVAPAGPMITTHNIEEFDKKAMAKKRMAKARAAKKRGKK
jgi:hypothetical protein